MYKSPSEEKQDAKATTPMTTTKPTNLFHDRKSSGLALQLEKAQASIEGLACQLQEALKSKEGLARQLESSQQQTAKTEEPVEMLMGQLQGSNKIILFLAGSLGRRRMEKFVTAIIKKWIKKCVCIDYFKKKWAANRITAFIRGRAETKKCSAQCITAFIQKCAKKNPPEFVCKNFCHHVFPLLLGCTPHHHWFTKPT